MCKPKREGGMGFKDLALFNKALLAKQAWRLLHNENSLFYRVFKAKFFPNCSILEAPDSAKGSYAWRSILKGREVLKKGGRWRVGNGKDISIWSDAWLPSISTPRVSNSMGIDFPEVRVNSLINAQTRNWDEDLLQALFKPEEVQLIRGISLGDVSVRDRMIWPHTQSGTYTVKSGYNLLSKEKENLDPLNTNPAPPQKLWKTIWSLSIPPKVRNFLWRAAKNAIPVKTNLVKWQVLQEEICDHCKAHSEDMVHALWLCPCLNEVWEADTSWNFKNTSRWDGFQKLILHVDEIGLDLDLFAMIVWLLWHRRNHIRVGNAATSLSQIVACA